MFYLLQDGCTTKNAAEMLVLDLPQPPRWQANDLRDPSSSLGFGFRSQDEEVEVHR